MNHSVSFRKIYKGAGGWSRVVWGGAGVCRATHPQGGSGGMPHRKILIFRPTEITSGAFFRPFVVSNDMHEMTIFLVVIRHLTPI